MKANGGQYRDTAGELVDPGKQRRPAAWDGLEGEVLLDSIYGYTYRVLARMEAQGTRPAILAVGNETDNGFVDATAPTDGFTWATDERTVRVPTGSLRAGVYFFRLTLGDGQSLNRRISIR